MDAKWLAVTAGIAVGTLNVWISREYVPGIVADAPGRRRDFDINSAAHVAIMAELMRFGLGVSLASTAAGLALGKFHKGYRFGVFWDPVQEGPPEEVGEKFGCTFYSFKSDVGEVLDDLTTDQRPRVYLTIDVGGMIDKMREAEKEYQSDPEIIRRQKLAALRAEMRALKEGSAT